MSRNTIIIKIIGFSCALRAKFKIDVTSQKVTTLISLFAIHENFLVFCNGVHILYVQLVCQI